MTDRELKLAILKLVPEIMTVGGSHRFVCLALGRAGADYLGIDENGTEYVDRMCLAANPAVWARRYNRNSMVDRVVNAVVEMQIEIEHILGHTTYNAWLRHEHGIAFTNDRELYDSRIAWVQHMIDVAEQEIKNDRS